MFSPFRQLADKTSRFTLLKLPGSFPHLLWPPRLNEAVGQVLTSHHSQTVDGETSPGNSFSPARSASPTECSGGIRQASSNHCLIYYKTILVFFGRCNDAVH
jgi:hypothetical protein